MKKIFFVIVILSFLPVLMLNCFEGKSVELASKCHAKTTTELNINQSEIIPYSPFFIKL